MKIAAFSDTHTKHQQVTFPVDPDIDVAIFAGDCSLNGGQKQVADFLNWYSSLDIPHKIFIPGNHEYFFDIHHRYSNNYKNSESYLDIIPDNIIYLENSETIIDGIKFWGSPVTPWFNNWAFNQVPKDIQKTWDLIPSDTDVLITHGPPYGTKLAFHFGRGQMFGCPSLRKKILEVKPQVHIFGHIHGGRGQDIWNIDDQEIKLYNCSVVNGMYEVCTEPTIIDI